MKADRKWGKRRAGSSRTGWKSTLTLEVLYQLYKKLKFASIAMKFGRDHEQSHI